MLVLKKVKQVELRTRKLVEGLLQGAYHSVFKGRGIEFSEVREYVYGDDVRAIDWNVTARMNHPYVKEFIEERDLNVMIVFDTSASANFGSNKEKKEAGTELAASLAFAAMRNNDNVGLLLFTDAVEKYVPMRKGRRHCLKLVRELVVFSPKKRGSSLVPALKFLMNIVKKRSIIFIISDFQLEGHTKQLRALAARHDVIAMRMQDIREMELPDIGYVELEDEETGEQILVNTSDSAFRKEFARIALKECRKFEQGMARLGVDRISFKSGEPFEVPLRKFFHERMRA
jgi:uncharacterized protein (DUF58 family)